MADDVQVSEIEEFVEAVGTASNSDPGNSIREPQPCAPECGPGHTPNYARVSCWAVSGNDAFFPCETTAPKLPPGHYTIKDSPRGIYFSLEKVDTDKLLILPDSASSEVLDNIRKFWGSEEKYRRLGFLWKRGIIMWGPPGSGKTCTVQLISQEIVSQGGIVLYVTVPSLATFGLSLARKIEPKRPIAAVIEDIDAVARCNEAELLALLDGENQVDNIVFIATTNYPERLDARIVNRPSRFDVVRKIPMPSPEAREFYLRSVHPRFIVLADGGSSDDLERWIEDTNEFSIAHIKELIVATEVYGSDYEETLKRLRAMTEKKSHSKDFEKPEIAGFAACKAAR